MPNYFRINYNWNMQTIYQALSEIEKNNETAALCTVVSSKGSTPREPLPATLGSLEK
jgi:hypothetical protein